MDSEDALIAQVEDVFRETYSAVPLAYEVFAVKIVFHARDDKDALATVLVPWLFPSLELAMEYRSSFVSHPIAGRLIEQWLDAGAISLPDGHGGVWIPLCCGVVPLNTGEIIPDVD